MGLRTVLCGFQGYLEVRGFEFSDFFGGRIRGALAGACAYRGWGFETCGFAGLGGQGFGIWTCCQLRLRVSMGFRGLG